MTSKPKTKTYIQAVCARCGKKYYKSETNHHQKYCSKDCSKKAVYANTRAREYTKACVLCGKLFETTRGYQKFCSAECAHEGKLRQMRVYARSKYREARGLPMVDRPRTLMQKIKAFFRKGGK